MGRAVPNRVTRCDLFGPETFASLIDAQTEPPISPDATLRDERGRYLAWAEWNGDATLAWTLTHEGRSRVRAEAHGWLDVFQRGELAVRGSARHEAR